MRWEVIANEITPLPGNPARLAASPQRHGHLAFDEVLVSPFEHAVHMKGRYHTRSQQQPSHLGEKGLPRVGLGDIARSSQPKGVLPQFLCII